MSSWGTEFMKHANVAIFVPHNGCPHQCSFCDQKSITGQAAQPSPEDVRAAAERARETLGPGCGAELAFFGGSFTAVEPAYMVSLLEAARPYVESGLFSGIRISTRPDCVGEDVLSLLWGYGVRSIELGAQSMREDVLRLNRRGHTARDVEEASVRIQERGFSLGLQMMTGLYGDDAEGARYTARKLAELRPDTVRIYPTVVMRGTELGRLYQKGAYIPPGLEETVPLCAELLGFFEDRGIRVIRLGLHDTPELRRDMLAGAYHPALGELCESRLFLDRLLSAAESRCPAATEAVRVAVNPKMVSKALGQKRRNLQALKEAGFRVEFLQDDSVPTGEFRILASFSQEEEKETADRNNTAAGGSKRKVERYEAEITGNTGIQDLSR